jgi:hypothetical protein
MVLVSYTLYICVSILQTKFSYGERHEARRGGLETMPLDQHIEGRHGEGEASVAIALQRHLTHGLSYMPLRDVVIAPFSRPPWDPILPWASPPLTCRPLGHRSAALVQAGPGPGQDPQCLEVF